MIRQTQTDDDDEMMNDIFKRHARKKKKNRKNKKKLAYMSLWASLNFFSFSVFFFFLILYGAAAPYTILQHTRCINLLSYFMS